MDAIVISNVAKSFKKTANRREHTSIKSELVRWLTGRRRRQPARYIEALKDVSFTVPQGRTVGIVGRNGSGKSTLLKLITGIYTPTAGTITVNGRISALLDLGAGFHPDFTGRENILINGIILGMSRDEVVRRTPEIVAFSELGDFVDEPVRTYSSGMFMRLAFAVAVHVDPEILIVDEILAVGDEHFARKSRAKMEEFKAQGKTILIVTHDLATLQRWCDLAIWIDGGRVRQVGEPHKVVQAYKSAVALAENQLAAGEHSALAAPGLPLPEGATPAEPQHSAPNASPEKRWGDFRGELTEVRLCTPSGDAAASYDPEAPLDVRISFVTKTALENAGFSLKIRAASGELVYETSTFADGVPLPSPLPRSGQLRLAIGRIGLVAGTYTVDLALHTKDGPEHDVHSGLYSFTVESRIRDGGVARPPHTWELLSDERGSELLRSLG